MPVVRVLRGGLAPAFPGRVADFELHRLAAVLVVRRAERARVSFVFVFTRVVVLVVACEVAAGGEHQSEERGEERRRAGHVRALGGEGVGSWSQRCSKTA